MAYKVVVNNCFGGASLSREAVLLGREISGKPNWMPESIEGDLFDDGTVVSDDYGHLYGIPRHDPILIKVVESLGENASGRFASLEVQTIDCNMYYIDEYDGNESVVTPGDQAWVIIEDEDE